ncbi:hypothetical protein CJ030_MR0G027270 [Morella rubra]|uniref:Uncharacterized protein n=1 Tax=Morella rubra TaxID=262757 RepID=A0A6A1UFN2_9ROSI|nr:hypothetical protein CJ030_MR0G027270 [Morella rubra]
MNSRDLALVSTATVFGALASDLAFTGVRVELSYNYCARKGGPHRSLAKVQLRNAVEKFNSGISISPFITK